MKVLAAFAAMLGALCIAPTADASIEYLSKFGGPGSGDGQFGAVTGIAYTSANQLLVLDASPSRVQRFRPNGSFVEKWGATGAGAGQFGAAYGLAVGFSGDSYVADVGNSRVVRFDAAGAFVATVGWGVQDGSAAFQVCSAGCQAGIPGSGVGQFNHPNAIATTVGGDVLVVEQDNARVSRFDSDLSPISAFGTSGTGAGQLNNPSAIALDSTGNIYVFEAGNNRISKFDSSGSFLMMWGYGVQDGSNVLQTCAAGCQAGLAGSGDGQLDDTVGMAYGPLTNDVYVADTQYDRVQIFTPSGGYVGKFGSSGSGDGSLAAPGGIAVDCKGALYVTDLGNSRVQRFGEPGTPLCMADEPAPNPTPTPTPNPDATAPKLFGMSVSPKRFRVGGKTKRGLRLGCKRANAKKRKKCVVRKTKLNFEISEAATVSFTIDGVVKGRKVGKKCKRTTVKNKRKKRCTAYKRAASFSRSAKTGKTSESFTGKIGKRKLRPGNYRMRAVAKDAAGNSSAPAVTTFTVLRR